MARDRHLRFGLAAAGLLVLAGPLVGARALDRTGLDAQIGRVFQEHAYDPPAFGPARWLPDGSAYSTVEPSAKRRLRHRPLRCRHRRAARAHRRGAAGAAGPPVRARHRRLPVVGRRHQAARLQQYHQGVAAEHPRRLLGARARLRTLATAGRRGAGLVADVRQVLARRDARGLRPRQRPLRRAAERWAHHAADLVGVGDDHQRHLRLGLRGGARRPRRLPLESG